MGGRAEPPEGAPEGGSGGEDEFRSVVFDESFVRAARIQELSAQERMSSGSRPIQRRGLRGGGLSRQALALMLLVSVAFAAAVYLGGRHPYPQPGGGSTELAISVLPLTAGPAGVPTLAPSAQPTPGATASPTATPTSTGTASASASGSAAAEQPALDPEDYPVGSSGLLAPNPEAAGDFTKGQVAQALALVQGYRTTSALDPKVLTGGNTALVEALLADGQQQQFDQSVRQPAEDRRHQLPGWMVRFDPTQVKLDGRRPIRTSGTLTIPRGSGSAGVLRLVSDDTIVYTLTRVAPAASAGPVAAEPTVLFTVRRTISYRLTTADLGDSRIELSDSVVEAGAMSCDADTSAYLVPQFPGQPPVPPSFARSGASGSPAPVGAAGVDPFDRSRSGWSACAVLTGPTP